MKIDSYVISHLKAQEKEVVVVMKEEWFTSCHSGKRIATHLILLHLHVYC